MVQRLTYRCEGSQSTAHFQTKLYTAHGASRVSLMAVFMRNYAIMRVKLSRGVACDKKLHLNEPKFAGLRTQLVKMCRRAIYR